MHTRERCFNIIDVHEELFYYIHVMDINIIENVEYERLSNMFKMTRDYYENEQCQGVLLD